MIIRPISIALTMAIILMLTTLAPAQVPSIAPPKTVPPTGAPETGAQTPEVPPSGAHPLTKADVEAWLDGFTPYALQRGDVAGAVVVVVKDGQVLLAKGYGYADVAARKPVDPERTLFRAGSVSKLFTWTAVMQLVEQGKLDLDADINGYLDFKIPPRNGKPITSERPANAGGGAETLDPAPRDRRRQHACLFQLRSRARRLHRAARVGNVIRRLYRAENFRSSEYDPGNISTAVAGAFPGRHVEGLQGCLGRAAAV